MMSRYFCLLLFAVVITSCSQSITGETSKFQGSVAAQEPAIILEDLTLAASDFHDSNASGIAFLPEGLMPQSDSSAGTYISEPVLAPITFNALVPQWTIDQPADSDLHLELRTGNDPEDLNEWVEIHPSRDWTLPEDADVVGEMLVVPAQDLTHRYVQFRFTLGSEEAQSRPLLRELRLTFIDSTEGPTVEEMIVRQEDINRSKEQAQNLAAEEAADNSKPFVISREVWCTNPACNYTEGLEYYPVSHLILHHTVSSAGADGDSAAVVRAIWAFHTSGRGWRDIGYNYLVDTKGVIYEGHLGGDDVVGIHASGANKGTMALAMIGTYSITAPPSPMFDSAVDLFSWKADLNDINVLDASDTLPDIEWGLPNLMGHRDVYGTTECPGGVAHALLPNMRTEIASRIGLKSPYIYIDELSSSFRKSSANWYDGPLQCGNNAHSWYTWSTTDQAKSANWGEWRPLIPESGTYQIEVYAPYCNTGEPETTGARYLVTHAEGASRVVINQDERVGLWTSLGKFTLNSGSETTIYLDDLTETDNGRGVWFDAIRLLPVELLPQARTETPADGSWLKKRNVTFSWQLENPEKTKATVLQVAADEVFQELVVDEQWSGPVLSTTINFEQDYANLYWRIVVTSESDKKYPSPASRFGIDSEPPASKVRKLYFIEHTGSYRVFWEGNDALSGVDRYNIDYRVTGAETWKSWQREVRATDAAFSPPDPGETYEFRSQAVDKLGNQEVLHATADISTSEALVFSHAVLLPLIRGN